MKRAKKVNVKRYYRGGGMVKVRKKSYYRVGHPVKAHKRSKGKK